MFKIKVFRMRYTSIMTILKRKFYAIQSSLTNDSLKTKSRFNPNHGGLFRGSFWGGVGGGVGGGG